jgi:hypothetical protein
MAKDYLTDDEVELEIERIRSSEAYKLAMAEKKYKYKRRQIMYTMRWYEKRGNELIAEGKTIDDFNESYEET